MKNKRFYSNKKRNEKWTEEEVGREIDFADKYVYNGIYSDKYDYLRPKEKKQKKINKQSVFDFFKKVGVFILAIAILGVGYTSMDVYMKRHTVPVSQKSEDDTSAEMNEVTLNLKSKYVESVTFDGSVMLGAVIDDLNKNALDSVTIDLKREDGSVAYQSALANIDTYGAVSFPATNVKKSVTELSAEDMVVVGRIYCYKDSIMPEADSSAAITNEDGSLYKDTSDNTYLNPNNNTTYNYIKDIVVEAYNMGIKVFVLDSTDLPSKISDSYNDGFDYLASKLYKDVGTDIKLLSPVNIDISNTTDEDKLDEEIKSQFNADLGTDKIYYVETSADEDVIMKKLEENGIENYILAE